MFKKKKRRYGATTRRFPRQHKFALVGMAGVVSIAFIWQPTIFDVSTSSSSVLIELDEESLTPLSAKDAEPLGEFIGNDAPEFAVEQDELDQILAQTDTEGQHKIAQGETLGEIFSQYSLPLLNMYQLLDIDPRLSNLRVGQKIEWVQDSNSGRVLEFRVIRSSKTTDTYVWDIAGYEHNSIVTEGEFQRVVLNGRVQGNFYTAAINAGMTANQIQNLVRAVQWRFDFGRESRRGDRFSIAVDREFIDGRAVSNGSVVGLLYRTGSRTIFAMRHEDGNFYDEEGQSLDRALMRVPLEKRFRISSSFNPNRKHPITGRVQPHNGTDFATPTGTPILSAGQGVVEKSEYHYAAGNYVVIRHGREYMTRYLHLDRRLVKVGDKVSMGQRIGLSGNTGRSTGPHLHYELIQNNRPVDAMRVPLPQAEPLTGSAKSNFVAKAQQVKTELMNAL
ncbi:murein DD-endopeptidase MepM [Thaumasiovibrio sp. DFM-14]|uniref:murein DD-endopeptidase MepM n=1 Tax=Thaumasiovibrio sp. DFM-14 TaxID=3384792 RepID=UPI0039A0354C